MVQMENVQPKTSITKTKTKQCNLMSLAMQILKEKAKSLVADLSKSRRMARRLCLSCHVPVQQPQTDGGLHQCLLHGQNIRLGHSQN